MRGGQSLGVGAVKGGQLRETAQPPEIGIAKCLAADSLTLFPQR